MFLRCMTAWTLIVVTFGHFRGEEQTGRKIEEERDFAQLRPSQDCAAGDTSVMCEVLRSFRVCGTCAAGDAAYERIGSANDGGYVMCTDSPAPDGALSIGIEGRDD